MKQTSEEERLEAHEQVLSELIEEHQSWADHCQDITNYMLPRKGRYLDKDSKPNDGGKRNDFINNSAGTQALRTSAAGMQHGLSSPAKPWFRLTVADKDLAKYAPVKQYLEEVREIMTARFASSNFYVGTYSVYKELLAFATGAVGMLGGISGVLNANPLTFGEYFIAMNAEREVDTLYRVFNMTARNVYQMFGEDARKFRAIDQALDQKQSHDWFKVVHGVTPNYDREYGMLDNRNMAWRSDYYLYEGHEGMFLRESGYVMFPFMVPRWDVTGSDVYGMGPGMDVLPDVKMLQKLESKILKGIDKQIDPAVNVPAALKDKVVNMLPGGTNYVGEGKNTNSTITPINDVRLSVRDAQYKANEVRQAINEGMYADLFKMLISSDDPNKTATEILKKHEEKLSLLGPVIERLQPEFLDKIIDRMYFLLDDRGLLPELPLELQQIPFEIEYMSPLVQAQKMLGTAAIEEAYEFAGAVAQFKPQILDKLNEDKTFDAYADMKGLPVELINDDMTVKKIRAARAKRQQMEKQAQTLERSASAVKDLSAMDPSQATTMRNAISGLGGISA